MHTAQRTGPVDIYVLKVLSAIFWPRAIENNWWGAPLEGDIFDFFKKRILEIVQVGIKTVESIVLWTKTFTDVRDGTR